MSVVTLKAEAREKLGTSEARKIKNSGLIPAVIYSKNGNVNLSISAKEFEQEYFKGNSLSSVLNIELGSKKFKVIAHKVELDPVSDRPVHIDFFNCDETKAFVAKPKLNFINQEKSPGLKRGGFLHVVLRKLEVVCQNEKSIPTSIDIDVGSMQVGQKIRISNVKLSDGVKAKKGGSVLIASIIGRGKAEEETTNTAAAATTAAAPAAGQAKAEDKKPADKK